MGDRRRRRLRTPSRLRPTATPDTSGTSPGMTKGRRSAMTERRGQETLHAPEPPSRRWRVVRGDERGRVPARRNPCPSTSCMSFLHRVSFHSVPSVPPPGCPERNPNSRVSRAGARARGRAFRAGAVRAPDCPDAPARANRTQGAPCLLAESGAFFAPPRTAERSGPASAAPFLLLPIITQFSRIQVISRIISENRNTTCFRTAPERGGCGRGPDRLPSAERESRP